jgi:hypothetical protein
MVKYYPKNRDFLSAIATKNTQCLWVFLVSTRGSLELRIKILRVLKDWI